MTIPTYDSLSCIFNDQEKAYQYAVEKKLIKEKKECCNIMMIKYDEKKIKCTRCGDIESIFKDTIFYKKKKKINDIILLFYLSLTKTPSTTILLQYCNRYTTKTVSETKQLYHEILTKDLIKKQHEVDDKEILSNVYDKNSIEKIGGRGIIVQIDESKFTKKKYGKGSGEDGKWVLGGVEKTKERKIFMTVVEERTETTLLDIITRNVKQGSVIHTDLWKSYNSLKEFGYTHKQVDHRKQFKTKDGVDTNTIEGNWASAKYFIKPASRGDKTLQSYLDEYIWRRRNENNIWSAFLNAVKNYEK